MSIILEPVSLDELSPIRVRFFLGRSPRNLKWKVLVAKYDGACRSGDDGETDGCCMLAMAKAGLDIWKPDGLIVDLTDFACRQLVDDLQSLLYVGEGYLGCINLPQAVIVGPQCERALRPFFDGPEDRPRSEAWEGCYRDIASAMPYLDEEMAKVDARFSGNRRLPETSS